MTQKIAYLDCSAGVSGALLLAALLDAGLPSDALDPIHELPIDDYQLGYGTFADKGIRGTYFQFKLKKRRQPERRLADITALLQASTLSSQVKETSLAIFQCLARAEASVRGVKVDEVQFYDAGAVDTIIDVVGVAIGIEALGISQLYASPLPLTGGQVKTAHSILPVPVPATLEILRRVEAPWKACSVEEELVTPTGAAILATLARFETPAMTIERVGYGFGRKRLLWPHCLRLCLGKAQDVATAGGAETDWVMVIESHIDTMSGELLGGLMERLFSAGALDVSYTPMQMKKNRPAILVTIISSLEKGNELAMIMLSETSTLGVRVQQVQRLKAQRSQGQVTTPFGPVAVKVKRLGSHIVNVAPEYEACRRIAGKEHIPLADVYEAVQRRTQSLVEEEEKSR